MSLGKRYDELHAQRMAEGLIRRRIERHWARMKSISPAMRKHFAEREVRVALVEAGLPLPVVVPFEELVARHLYLCRRDPAHYRTIYDRKIKAAVRAELDREGV